MPNHFHEAYWKPLQNPVYVETGLLNGKSLLKAHNTGLFKKLVSIEISAKHVKDFLKTNAFGVKSKQVSVIHGNSKDLAKYIAEFSEPITFFLDAHDDQRFNVQRNIVHDNPGIACPLLEELEAIAVHPKSLQHKILIDDLQCFKPGFQHPHHDWFKGLTKTQVLSKVKELFPNHALYLLDSLRPKDVLVVVPEKTAIPKVLHMTYKNKADLTQLFKRCKTKAKQFYQDFEFRFWDDQAMNEFMEVNYPDFYVQVFSQLPLKIMQVDVFRYCLMETIGGLYLDMDHELCRRYAFEDADLFLCLNRDRISGDSSNLVGNSIIASKPGHSFWKCVRDELTANITNVVNVYKPGMVLKDLKKYVLSSTGPEFLDKVYKKYASSLTQVRLVPKKVFHFPLIQKSKIFAPPTTPRTNAGSTGKPVATFLPKTIPKLTLNVGNFSNVSNVSNVDAVVQMFISSDLAHCGFHHCSGSWHTNNDNTK